jgi:enoyl-CoA hydratase/carnithine racemase
MNRLDTLPCTTLGVIGGACFGGGFELALTLDVLIAEPSARFCFPELRLGIVPGFGGIPRLMREAPAGVVRDLLLSGRSLGVKRARELGLVSQTVATGQGLEVARALARQTALFAPDAVAAAKALMKQVPEAALAQEKEAFLRLFASPDVEHALARFVASEDVMPYQPEAE